MTSQSIFDLSPEEKLKLVEELWDNLATTPENVPVHDWQLEELERRKERLEKKPESALTWEDLKNQIRRDNGR